MGNQPTNQLTPDRVRELLDLIEWRPGWRLGLVEANPPYGPILLRISGFVPDTYTGELQEISHTATLSPYEVMRDDLGFVREVHRALQNVDMHEASEWFTVNGVRVADPHHTSYTGKVDGPLLDAALAQPTAGRVHGICQDNARPTA